MAKEVWIKVDVTLLLAVLLLCAQVAVPSPLYAMEKRAFCTKNMPCMWAVCPWSRYPRISPKYDPDCVHIQNEGCRCPQWTECIMSSRASRFSGSSYVKYDYRCKITVKDGDKINYYALTNPAMDLTTEE